MSSGYLVLIIYDLYCKCLERVFVKILEVLVSDVQAGGTLQEMQPLPRWAVPTGMCRPPEVS